jgi:hypothetical protein
LIHVFNLQVPNVRGKTATDSSDLLAILSFNTTYDFRVFPSERQRLSLTVCYLVLAYTGCRPAEVVDGDKSMPLDGFFEELIGSQAILPLSQKPPEDSHPDAYAKELTKLLERETTCRSRPKALCYDIRLMVARHSETGLDTLAMSAKFIRHKGVDNNRNRKHSLSYVL